MKKKSPKRLMGIKALGTWQRRYFVLPAPDVDGSHALLYYNTKAQRGGEPVGVIPICMITKVEIEEPHDKTDTFCRFNIYVEKGEFSRVFKLNAESQANRDVWVNVLQKSISLARARSAIGGPAYDVRYSEGGEREGGKGRGQSRTTTHLSVPGGAGDGVGIGGNSASGGASKDDVDASKFWKRKSVKSRHSPSRSLASEEEMQTRRSAMDIPSLLEGGGGTAEEEEGRTETLDNTTNAKQYLLDDEGRRCTYSTAAFSFFFHCQHIRSLIDMLGLRLRLCFSCGLPLRLRSYLV